MSRMMMLVSAEGATLAETRLDDPSGDNLAAAALMAEARVSGFSEDEVQAARVVVVGDF